MSKYEFILELISTMKDYSSKHYVSIPVLITMASEILRVLNEIKEKKDEQ